MNHEIRYGSAAHLDEKDSHVRVSGYAAVFNQRAKIETIFGNFNEQISPGAFRNAIGRDDTLYLINHRGMPLARTASGTLTLTEDDKGLYSETELDKDDPEVRSLVVKIRRGDVNKMSFGFLPEEDGEVWDEGNDIPVRTLTSVRLFDVSPVGIPAYQGTDVGIRSFESYLNKKRINHSQLRMKMNLALRRICGHPA